MYDVRERKAEKGVSFLGVSTGCVMNVLAKSLLAFVKS